MGKTANDATSAANKQDTQWQQSALNNYNSDASNYMSNVNSTLAAGNPYQSKAYLTNQNLMTSGAMNSANTAAAGALRQNAAVTGENGAATAATIASNARAGQRDLTNYNATRDTMNDQAWQGEKQGLLQDQLAGANSEANVFGTATSGQNAALGDMTSLQNAQDQMWGDIVGRTVGAAGTAAAALH